MDTRGTGVRIGLCCALTGAGAALTVAACGDTPGAASVSVTEFSQAFCQKTIACECAPVLAAVGLVAPLTCNGWNLTDLSPAPDSAGEYGGEYGDAAGDEFGGNDYGGDETFGGDVTITADQNCIDRIADALSSASCDLPVPLLGCADYCKIYYGTRFEFQPCASEAECAQGLTCSASECRNPCNLPTGGEVDGNDDDGGDEGGILCGDETCDGSQWCDSTDPESPSCRALGGVGAACMGHAECSSGSCPAGTCAELPGPGQPCSESGRCTDGVTCLRSAFSPVGVCTVVPPACAALISFADELG